MKKIIALILAIILVAGVSIVGTMAWLQDDDSSKNTMVLGDVYIEQIEQERDENGNLVAFTQNKPVYPCVYEGTSIPWADEDAWIVPGDQAWKVVQDNENVVDKFVSVKNTGSADAYVRTIMLFEVGENAVNDPYMHLVCNTTNVTGRPTWKLELLEEDGNTTIVEIDGNYYWIGVFTYTGVLQPEQTTIPNIKQIYLGKEATNEICAVYGDTFDVLVISQGVQAAGFADATTALNAAFGKVTATNVLAWFANIAP